MVTVAKAFEDKWDNSFESVDAFVEPTADWWKSTGTQEGCHINVATQATIVGHLQTHLSQRRLDTIISAPDESPYDQAISTLQSIGSTALNNIGRINVHGYQHGSGRRDLVSSLTSAATKPLWNSEYGDGVASGADLVGLSMAAGQCLGVLASPRPGWLAGGLIDADNDVNRFGQAAQKYFDRGSSRAMYVYVPVYAFLVVAAMTLLRHLTQVSPGCRGQCCCAL
jgi:galactan endo-1,6-beta-galactosidase